MDKIWDRKSFEVGGEKNEWPRRTRAKYKHVFKSVIARNMFYNFRWEMESQYWTSLVWRRCFMSME